MIIKCVMSSYCQANVIIYTSLLWWRCIHLCLNVPLTNTSHTPLGNDKCIVGATCLWLSSVPPLYCPYVIMMSSDATVNNKTSKWVPHPYMVTWHPLVHISWLLPHPVTISPYLDGLHLQKPSNPRHFLLRLQTPPTNQASTSTHQLR